MHLSAGATAAVILPGGLQNFVLFRCVSKTKSCLFAAGSSDAVILSMTHPSLDFLDVHLSVGATVAVILPVTVRSLVAYLVTFASKNILRCRAHSLTVATISSTLVRHKTSGKKQEKRESEEGKKVSEEFGIRKREKFGRRKGTVWRRRGNRRKGCFFGNRKRGPKFQRRRESE